MEVRLSRYQLHQLAEIVADKLLEKMDARKMSLPAEKLLDAKEAAAYLHIDVRTLYNLGAKIGHTKVGRKSLYSEKELYNYIHR